MSSSSFYSTPSRGRADQELGKTDQGVAEWSKKIRDLQLEVDRDEELETKKLEAEIAASRLARASRRHTALGSVGDTTGFSSSSPNPRFELNSSDTSDKVLGRFDALKKLEASNSFNAPQNRSYDYNAIKSHVPGSNKPVAKGEPISLAAFMGGTASGPRLNKVHPQEEYNPDLYASRPDIPGAHPIFGRAIDPYEKGKTFGGTRLGQGGIALPGMGAKKLSPVTSTETDVLQNPRLSSYKHDPSPIVQAGSLDPTFPDRDWELSADQSDIPSSDNDTISTPFMTNRPLLPRKPVNLNESRPSFPHPAQNPVPPESPVRVRSTKYDEFGSPPPALHVIPDTTSTTPKTSSTTITTPPPLARPIQPDVKPPKINSPSIPPSSKPSPAFLKPPTPKEPTPSLSRLQGRGFVEQRVKASAVLEAEKEGPASPSGGSKKSVLSRWPPAAASTPDLLETRQDSPTPESPTRPRRTSAIDRNRETEVVPRLSKTVSEHPRRPPGAVALPSLAKKSPTAPPRMMRTPEHETQVLPSPVALPGLGSSTTMISYVRCQKTGPSDNEGVKSRSPNEYDGPSWTSKQAREVKLEDRGRSSESVAPVLTHPTKSRAKKPQMKKTSSTQQGDKEGRTIETTVVRDVAVASAVQSSPEPLDKAQGNLESTASQSPNTGIRERRSSTGGQKRRSSSGSYTSVKEIAQAIEEQAVKEQQASSSLPSPSNLPKEKPRALDPRPKIQPGQDSVVQAETSARKTQSDSNQTMHHVQPPAVPLSSISSQAPEIRRSTVDRYSSIALPPLKEEATPTQSPAGTVSRIPTELSAQQLSARELEKEEEWDDSETEQDSPSVNPTTNSGFVSFDHHDKPLPPFDTVSLMKAADSPFMPNTSLQPISTEAFLFQGPSLIPLELSPLLVYDSDLIATVFRAKSRATGLVSTKVFRWRGHGWTHNPVEEKKLSDLASRYAASIISCNQGSEPAEFLHVLGNRMVTRQGPRAHWAIENTTMHRVRNIYGSVMIDEVDFHIENLCSGFSYVLSILGTLYVWHGYGAVKSEQQEALRYAQSMSTQDLEVKEVNEEQEDEMFWMMLGDNFTSAHYWKLRDETRRCDPRVFEIATSNEPIRHLSRFCGLDMKPDMVVVIDCWFELFILVGDEARDRRQEIRMGLAFAEDISKRTQSSRPFPSPVHVIILPSTLPVELRIALRFINEAQLNRGKTPEHMNLLPLATAEEHIRTPSWPAADLLDDSFLPLGLGPSLI